MTKIAVAVRLSPVAKRQVELLSKRLGLTQTAVIETAVRQLAKKEKVNVMTEFDATVPQAREKFLDMIEEKRIDPELIAQVSGCPDVLPRVYCDMLDLKQGSTYAEAAEHLANN